MMKEKWTHVGTCIEGQPVLIDGVDVWKHDWTGTELRAKVKDPMYGQDLVFHVYTLIAGDKQIEFAAGEFSNGIWGVFKRERN